MRGRVLDLFAGCGGFSLGFDAAGFEIVDGIELAAVPHATYAANFHAACVSSKPRDIRQVDAREYEGSRVDVIIGGPPCQPFARIGRAKLREIAGERLAHLSDPRVSYYTHFFRFVESLRPAAFVMENVRDIARFGGRNIAEEIAATGAALGYEVRYAILNAAWFGVPQMRERLLLIGLDGHLQQAPQFPSLTHAVDLPVGYATSRHGRDDSIPVLEPHDYYTEDFERVLNPASAITTGQALGDLPAITEHLRHMKSRAGARRFLTEIAYNRPARNGYQRLMRSWPGLEQAPPPADHVIRYTPRDYTIFRNMKPGDQYPEAHQIAERRFVRRLAAEERRRGKSLRSHGEQYQELRRACVPPYDPSKFPNKWRKMEAYAPARTVTAHLGKDTYSHIHYDSDQARTISVREAARLQSFPDGFRFCGAMNDGFKQIGNSVPPLMAYAIASALRTQLKAAGVITEKRRRSGRTDSLRLFVRVA